MFDSTLTNKVKVKEKTEKCIFQSPTSLVQLYLSKTGCVTSLSMLRSRPSLSPSDDRKLVRMCRSNPGTTKAQTCQELETTGKPALLSTVKRVLHRYGLRHCWSRDVVLFQNQSCMLEADICTIRDMLGFNSCTATVPTVKHSSGGVMLWGYLAASGTLHTMDRIMKKNTLNSSTSPQIRQLKLGYN